MRFIDIATELSGTNVLRRGRECSTAILVVAPSRRVKTTPTLTGARPLHAGNRVARCEAARPPGQRTAAGN